MIFTKTFQNMLKQGLALNRISERWIRYKKYENKISELNAKNYIWFTGYENEKRKAKGTSKCVIKIKKKFENCWDTAQLENKTNHLEKDNNDAGFHKEFKKTEEVNKIFTEEVNKIALTSNYDKIIQSIDWMETFAHGLSRDLYVRKKKLNSSI